MKTDNTISTVTGDLQDDVDLAYVSLLLVHARRQGLVSGGPEVDLDRVIEILHEGEMRGVLPSEYAVERILISGLRPGRKAETTNIWSKHDGR